jgi:hypothetical protein
VNKVVEDSPTSLYKYLPADRTSEVLGKLLIRFSQVSVLNDALEFKPPLIGLAPKQLVKELVIEKIQSKYPALLEQVRQKLPAQIAEKMIDDVISDGADDAEKNRDNYYKTLDENFGLLSLSEIATDKLMWSHYADGGRGFLIEFNPKHPWFSAKKAENDDFRQLRRVIYVASRPPKYLKDATGTEVLYTKGQEWEYEKEWRIIRNFNDAASKVGPDGNGKDVLLFAIPPDCVRGMVIGYRATEEAVERVRNIVSANEKLSHVRFREAEIIGDGSIEIIASG